MVGLLGSEYTLPDYVELPIKQNPHIQSRFTLDYFLGFTWAHKSEGLFFCHACLSSGLFVFFDRDGTETEDP